MKVYIDINCVGFWDVRDDFVTVCENQCVSLPGLSLSVHRVQRCHSSICL